VAETGGTLIPPYDHPHVIAGQGTAVLELLDEVPDLDTVIAPVGGGGLASGMCLAVAARGAEVRILGAEPAGADDAARSLARGERLPQLDPRTVADGLRTGLGELTFPILSEHLRGILTVDDDGIIAAMRLLFERAKLVVEPSGAVGLAAVLAHPEACGERVGIVLTGGNVDLDALPW
jgi:threonine dehydratase